MGPWLTRLKKGEFIIELLFVSGVLGPIPRWRSKGDTLRRLPWRRHCCTGARQAVQLTCGRYKPAVVGVMAQLWIVVTYKLVQWFVLRSVAADNGHNHLWKTNWAFYKRSCCHSFSSPEAALLLVSTKSRFLALTKRSAAFGNENGCHFTLYLQSSTISLKKKSRDALPSIVVHLVFLD